MRGLTVWLQIGLVLLPAIAWCQTGSQVGRPAPGAIPGAPPGANDLFAALAAPDHEQRIERLRAARAMLGDGAGTREMAAARAQLDALLASEAAASDQPPAIVMSALAARIDAAIARLEKTSGGGDGTDALVPAALAWPVLCALTALQAALLLLAAMALRHRLDGTALVPAVLARLDELSPRIGAVLARAESRDRAAESADSAAAALAMIDPWRDAAREIEHGLREAAGLAASRLAQAGAVVAQSERVAGALPALMGEAVSNLEARGLPAFNDAIGQLRDTVDRLAGEQSAAMAAAAPTAEILAGALAPFSAKLTAGLSELREDAAGHNATLAEGLSALTKRLDQLAAEAAPATPDAVVIAEIAAQLSAALVPPAADPAVAALPAAVVALAAQLAPIELAAREAAAVLDSIDTRVSASLSQMPQAAAALASAADRLALSGDIASQHEQMNAQMRLSVERVTRQTDGVAMRVEAGLADAAAMQSRHQDAVEAAMRRQTETLDGVMGALCARADAALAVLTPEAGLLSAVGCRLADEAVRLRGAAGELAVAAARTPPANWDQLAALLADGMDALHRELVGGEGVAQRGAASASPSDGAMEVLPALLADGVAAIRADLAAWRPAASLPETPPPMPPALAELPDLLREGITAIRADLARLAVAPATAPAPALGPLVAAFGGVAEAMARVAAKTEAHEASLQQVMLAAVEVQAALRAAPRPARNAPLDEVARNAPLDEVAEACALISGECELLAQAALRGETAQLPRDLPARLPVLLDTIDTSIGRLRGCATALAMASDRQAA